MVRGCLDDGCVVEQAAPAFDRFMKQSKPFLVAAVAAVSAACSGGSVDNAAPRIDAVPIQTVARGGAFSIDLATYVTDLEEDELSYEVVSGGGSFAGSVYSTTFATMGEYGVTFRVSDGAYSDQATFTVDVTTGRLAVVSEGSSGLLVLDTRTGAFRRLASTAPTPRFLAPAGSRHALYELGLNGALWIYDAYSKSSIELAATIPGNAALEAVTADGKVLYTTGEAPAVSLWLYDPGPALAQLIGESLASPNVTVGASGEVFFQVETGGQSDIVYYSPSSNITVTVSDDSADEQIVAVTPDGGVVFRRVGAGGEFDLLYCLPGAAVAEVGADVAGMPDRDKTFALADSDSRIVFTAEAAGNDELFAWDPATAQTTTIRAGVDTEVFAEIGAGDELVYSVASSGSVQDVYYHDLDDGVTATLRAAGDTSVVLAVTSDGAMSWALIQPGSALAELHVISLDAVPTSQVWLAGGDAGLGAVLENGDLIAQRDDGAAIAVFDVAAGGWTSPIAGSGLDVAGAGLAAGDFVYEVQVSGQGDLMMWDASVGSPVTISSDVDDDAYDVADVGAAIFFQRRIGGAVTRDLFCWDGTATKQLTGAATASSGLDYEVRGEPFTASR